MDYEAEKNWLRSQISEYPYPMWIRGYDFGVNRISKDELNTGTIIGDKLRLWFYKEEYIRDSIFAACSTMREYQGCTMGKDLPPEWTTKKIDYMAAVREIAGRL